ncbi:glycosyltransferase family 8 protein [uncultured Cetobacterium sp.]|uniref:glycosyltransferase family 8 protein n=1 Tax=uncultured Cetobacterium sp. TaxID=527638 RepID=UPI002624B71E|nr:glycosyltransferase family 8 protein [uncultured Cetobacterium sp.]
MKNLVLIINEKNSYGRHLGATLLSVLKNSKENWNINIIYENLSSESKSRLNEMVKSYNSNINYIEMNKEILKKFKVGVGTHLSSIVFARLFIPEFLKNEDRAIYLDCDIVVLKPLEKLYEMDLNGKSIGVILDGKKDQKSSLQRLNLSLERTYFNAGVMVMDLKKLRENSKFLKTIDYCLSPDRELQLNEQDALNIMFENDYMINDLIWNYTHGNSEENNCLESEIGIVHFTGDVKPWDCRSYSPYKHLYWRYLNETPWKGFEEENKTLKNILKRELVKFKLKTRKIRYILKGKK